MAITMHIAHIVEAFEGGIVTYMRTVLPRLVELGCDITLICSVNRQWPGTQAVISELSECGVKVSVVPMSREIRLLADARAFAAIYMLLAKGSFDAVHTHCSKAGVIGRLAAWMAGVKTIVHTPHCFSFLRNSNRAMRCAYRLIERALGRLTDRLVAVSLDERQVAITSRILPASRCTVVNNGITIPCDQSCYRNQTEGNGETRRALGIPTNARLVLTVCRLTKYKGLFSYLEAAGLSRHEDALFLVAGSGDLLESMRAFIASNNLCDRVRILGYMENMESLYEASDLAVLCSDAEGQPYAILEAMGAGLAVVASDVPGNRSVVQHNKTGRLVGSEAGQIVAAVDELLDSSHLRRLYGSNAYEYVCRHHSADSQAQAILKVYRQCIIGNAA